MGSKGAAAVASISRAASFLVRVRVRLRLRRRLRLRVRLRVRARVRVRVRDSAASFLVIERPLGALLLAWAGAPAWIAASRGPLP